MAYNLALQKCDDFVSFLKLSTDNWIDWCRSQEGYHGVHFSIEQLEHYKIFQWEIRCALWAEISPEALEAFKQRQNAAWEKQQQKLDDDFEKFMEVNYGLS